MRHCISLRPYLPPKGHEARLVIERWACWGWSVAAATQDQDHPNWMRQELHEWLNTPAIQAAFWNAGARPGYISYWLPSSFRPEDCAPCCYIEEGSPAEPPLLPKGWRKAERERLQLERDRERETARATRDSAIYADRKSGMTLDAVGKKHDLTRERVRGIVAKRERELERERVAALRKAHALRNWSQQTWTPEKQYAANERLARMVSHG